MYTRPVLADFSHLDALLAELDSYRPLPQDVTRKLTEKLRLDWNYHSNALEGNTLTYGETKALLLADRYVGNKEGRHYREISAHNDVLKTLDELVNVDKNRALTESLIRDLHKQMLGEPFYANSETPDGQPTRKLITPGEYKKLINYVPRSTGDNFYYADPIEVVPQMQELLEAYREINTDPKIHPVALAAWFHYEFIRIHPFDDGNGRLARILMNLILQRRGLVPAIVRVEEKTAYIDALAVADGTDDLTEFTLFIATQVERILDLSVRAAKGEDITEPEDWKKKIKLLRLGAESQIQKTTFFSQTKLKDRGDIVRKIVNIGSSIIEVVAPLFHNYETKVYSNDSLQINISDFKKTKNDVGFFTSPRTFQINYLLWKARSRPDDSLSVEYNIIVTLKESSFEIRSFDFTKSYNYKDLLTIEDVEHISEQIGKRVASKVEATFQA